MEKERRAAAPLSFRPLTKTRLLCCSHNSPIPFSPPHCPFSPSTNKKQGTYNIRPRRRRSAHCARPLAHLFLYISSFEYRQPTISLSLSRPWNCGPVHSLLFFYFTVQEVKEKKKKKTKYPTSFWLLDGWCLYWKTTLALLLLLARFFFPPFPSSLLERIFFSFYDGLLCGRKKTNGLCAWTGESFFFWEGRVDYSRSLLCLDPALSISRVVPLAARCCTTALLTQQ